MGGDEQRGAKMQLTHLKCCIREWAVEAPWWVWAARGKVSAGIQGEVTAVLAKWGAEEGYKGVKPEKPH